MRQVRKRLFITSKTSAGKRVKIIRWAVENEYNTLVLPLNDKFFRGGSGKYIKLIKHYAFLIEAGGDDLSVLLPRGLFLFNKELFRMEEGKRKRSNHFCPTNPKTIAIIAKRARKLFSRAMQKMTLDRIFHLLPDEGQQDTWCQCPACRAFRPSEQYLIAVNTAADALAKLDSQAILSYIDFDTEPEAAKISPRANTVILS
ncbi:MAG: DUF4838 domain-containing protein [Treponema sp.]|jgi:hypothetical protein|nr:DUF4838 domain-containing protein [Treponema sp.]